MYIVQNYPPFPIYEHTHTFECHERQYKSIRILTHRQMQKNFFNSGRNGLQFLNMKTRKRTVCVHTHTCTRNACIC